jgi:hypothetical protein
MSKSLYTIWSLPMFDGKNQYKISKFTAEGDPVDSYTMMKTAANGIICDCPAMKSWCRHATILQRFEKDKTVDSGLLYDYDRGDYTGAMKKASP